MEEKGNGIVLSLCVSPASGSFEVCGFNAGRLKLKTKSKAEKGYANIEIEKELGRIFKGKARIFAGFKSRNKKLFVEGITKEKAIQLLGNL